MSLCVNPSVSVGHIDEPCKNDLTDQGTYVSDMDFGQREQRTVRGKGKFFDGEGLCDLVLLLLHVTSCFGRVCS